MNQIAFSYFANFCKLPNLCKGLKKQFSVNVFLGSDSHFRNGVLSSGTFVIWPRALRLQVVWRDVLTGQQFLQDEWRVSIPGPRA